MADQPVTLAQHLERLEADAADVSAFLTAQHRDGGDIHPEALTKAAVLQTSLREVINALTQHEHLAMNADDVWQMLNRKHDGREINPG